MSKTESYRMTLLDLSKEPEQKKPIELIEYDVWMGGFAATGEHAPAHFVGKLKGRNFQDACMRHFMKEHLEHIEKMDAAGEYYDSKRWDYDPYKNTYWACGLYDNEADARKNFG